MVPSWQMFSRPSSTWRPVMARTGAGWVKCCEDNLSEILGKKQMMEEKVNLGMPLTYWVFFIVGVCRMLFHEEYESLVLSNAHHVRKGHALQPKVMNSEELVRGSRRSSRTTCRWVGSLHLSACVVQLRIEASSCIFEVKGKPEIKQSKARMNLSSPGSLLCIDPMVEVLLQMVSLLFNFGGEIFHLYHLQTGLGQIWHDEIRCNFAAVLLRLIANLGQNPPTMSVKYQDEGKPF